MSKLSKRDKLGVSGQRPFAGMSKMRPNAAGLDIGAHEIVGCVPGEDENTQEVQTFGTYTVDLEAIGDWFQSKGVTSVAMESTGVYWIPVFEYLESIGIECCLISAAALKKVPGRKTDVLDSQWIQTLHSYGLLNASFRPEADLVALRTLLRHRAQLLEHRSPHILHMQKALLQMNLQLSQVLTAITGQTGLLIIRAIVAGERDPQQLAALRNWRCQKDEAEIAEALTGTWRAEHLFVLRQSLAMYDFYTSQLAECDQEIERTFSLIKPRWGATAEAEAAIMAAGGGKKDNRGKNAPENVRSRAHIKRITGVDLVAVPGISASLAQTILAEIGTDMSKFPNEKHFCSWLGLAPKNEVSGGKTLKSRTLKTKNRAGQAFRMAARAQTRADSEFGAFYRRMKSRLGPAQAMVATAHKLARVVYHMLSKGEEYRPLGAAKYEQQFKERQVRFLKRKAAKLGLQVVPT
jgi:transposase